MSRLAGVFADLKSNGRKGVIPYVVAGDPTPEGTVISSINWWQRGQMF